MTAFTRQLVHTCTIKRISRGRGTSGGIVETWIDYLTGQVCRYVEKQEKYADEAVGFMTQVTQRLLLPTGIEVTPSQDYRVDSITIEDGSTLGPFQITEVLTRRGAKGQNHISLKLEKIG